MSHSTLIWCVWMLVTLANFDPKHWMCNHQYERIRIWEYRKLKKIVTTKYNTLLYNNARCVHWTSDLYDGMLLWYMVSGLLWVSSMYWVVAVNSLIDVKTYYHDSACTELRYTYGSSTRHIRCSAQHHVHTEYALHTNTTTTHQRTAACERIVSKIMHANKTDTHKKQK